ncbi:uncharacterized protein LOC112512792 [Cynara cardunculus var. scolymus]|uniref:uncharacterized protein LOC112512792 n=1 Tax=Cynara cardunculus var. scolymus TaxID=59895 RepID=UPI000D628D24|nr:uncharacterized protein LOC112512792 [Cynara cardunculus var. scolymus]
MKWWTSLEGERKKLLALKLDFQKAFDSLNWDFLLNTMKHMSFGEKWCKWIQVCLRSASIFMLVNGSPTEEFQMSRGVRQAFLFIIAAEGLSVAMKVATSRRTFEGVKVDKDQIEVSHLQYVDDIVFFGEWSRTNDRNLLGILNCFQ